MTQTSNDGRSERERGEVVISGLDTGPDEAERENLSPTEDQARFLPTAHPAGEPTDEDG